MSLCMYICVYILYIYIYIYLIIGHTGDYNCITLNENNDNTCTQGAFTI